VGSGVRDACAEELAMALNGLRWFVAAVVCCAVIWFGALFRATNARPITPDEAVQRSRIYRGSPALAVEGRLAQVNDRLRTLELRDSIVSVAKQAGSGSFVLLVDPGLTEATRQNLSTAITRQWAALGIPSGARNIVAVVIDTFRTPHGLPRTGSAMYGMPLDVFLPSTETKGACIALLTLHTWPARSTFARFNARLLSSSEMIESLLSPCAFYAAFGAPSRSIRSWLDDLHWTPARLADWNEASSSWRPAFNPVSVESAPSRDRVDQLRSYISPGGLSCVAGEREACRRVLFEPRHVSVDSAWRAGVITPSVADASNFYRFAGPTMLGPAQGSILSEMVRTLGRERFAQFWHSPLAAADAFKEAGGQDADSWTHAWAQRMYGVLNIQPAVSSNGLFAGIVLVAIGLAGATYIGVHRRVVT